MGEARYWTDNYLTWIEKYFTACSLRTKWTDRYSLFTISLLAIFTFSSNFQLHALRSRELPDTSGIHLDIALYRSSIMASFSDSTYWRERLNTITNLFNDERYHECISELDFMLKYIELPPLYRIHAHALYAAALDDWYEAEARLQPR